MDFGWAAAGEACGKASDFYSKLSFFTGFPKQKMLVHGVTYLVNSVDMLVQAENGNLTSKNMDNQQ